MESSKNIRAKLNDLYHDISDSFTDIKGSVSENTLSKSTAVGMLEEIYNNGKSDYIDIKSSNSNAEKLFIESDKKFNPLFGNIQNHIDQYNADLDFIK